MINRFAWAVKAMNMQAHHRVLEIGCGVGHAIPELMQHLSTGQLTAIDRSASAIQNARKRNAALLESGRLHINEMALQQATYEAETFHRVMCFNVNLFWTGSAAKELKLIHDWLKPNGELYLFFSPPSPRGAPGIVSSVERNLRDGGFVVDIIEPVDRPCLVGLSGQKKPDYHELNHHHLIGSPARNCAPLSDATRSAYRRSEGWPRCRSVGNP